MRPSARTRRDGLVPAGGQAQVRENLDDYCGIFKGCEKRHGPGALRTVCHGLRIFQELAKAKRLFSLRFSWLRDSALSSRTSRNQARRHAQTKVTAHLCYISTLSQADRFENDFPIMPGITAPRFQAEPFYAPRFLEATVLTRRTYSITLR